MKLTALICFILVSESLSVPLINQLYNSADKQNESYNMPNCYESKDTFYSIINSNNIKSINEFLISTASRTPIYIKDTKNNSCGVSIVNDRRLKIVDINYGPISKKDCNTSKVICDQFSNCNAAYDCCENATLNCDNQYQITPILRHSSEYNKTITDCGISYPSKTNCFKLSKITDPADSSGNLVYILYASYIIPLLVTIKNFRE
jgi:hypothetical protein